MFIHLFQDKMAKLVPDSLNNCYSVSPISVSSLFIIYELLSLAYCIRRLPNDLLPRQTAHYEQAVLISAVQVNE